MKTYGESLMDIRCENYSTNRSGRWKGNQSRKVARRRSKDKKLLHRRARHTAVIEKDW
jgi:hypothetical protein